MHFRVLTPSLFRSVNYYYVALILLFILLFPMVSMASPRFGLWIEAEGKVRPFESKDQFAQMLKFVQNGHFTDLYCQVYRGGRSWFPSIIADDSPYRESLDSGVDVLKDLIKVAHSRGQKVHAWLNILSLTQNKNAPLIQVVGKEAVLVDNFGNSLLDYDAEGRPPGEISKFYRIETPSLWLDPSNPKTREYILATIEDLLHSYPEIDGIHLDMIRFSYGMPIKPASWITEGLDFGYAPASVDRFYSTYADEVKKKIPSGAKWDDWRRSQVTLMVTEIRELLNRTNPNMELSAAVLAWPDRAYQSAFQDWQGWLTGGQIDVVLPMAYTRDQKLFNYLSKQATPFVPPGKIYMGLGAWLLLKNSAGMTTQVESALKAGSNGVVLFSYANLASTEGLELTKTAYDSILAMQKNTFKH